MLAEIFITIFLFTVIIGITAFLFVGWAIFSIIRLIIRALGLLAAPILPSPSKQQQALPGQPWPSRALVTCSNQQCRNVNPATASFCRRCGHSLPRPQRVAVSRAAMW